MNRRTPWTVTLALVPLLASVTAAQSTPEEAVRAFFRAGSGEAGRQSLDSLPLLFVASGVLISVRVSDSVPAQAWMRSPGAYVDESRGYLAGTTQYEVPTHFWVEEYGNVGQVFASFEARHTPLGEAFYRGVASFQLLRTADGWKIITAYWQGERPGQPLPARYRP